MFRMTMTAVLLAILLAGCTGASPPTSDSEPKIVRLATEGDVEAHQWDLAYGVTADGTKSARIGASMHFTSDGTFRGSFECRSVTGNWSMSEGVITTRNVDVGEELCDASGPSEPLFLAALNSPFRVTLATDDNQLRMTSKHLDGALLFRPSDAEKETL